MNINVGDKFYYIKDKKTYQIIGMYNNEIILQNNKNDLYSYYCVDFYRKFILIANNNEYKKDYK